jgi:hypothetical protein
MDLERIRARIADIAASPKHVRFEDLCNLLDNHVGPRYANYNHHGNPHHAFTLGDQTFNIAQPHSGFIKRVYIKKFLDAMEALGLHSPEDDGPQQVADESGE